MKNDRLTKVVAVALLLAMLAMISMSGTYAKYTSEISASDTAVVAKWSFKVSGTEIAVEGSEPTVSFDLFKTIKDSNGTDNETDVSANLIAPGTSGSFDLKLKNESEVTANYAIDYTVTNTNNIPILFSTDGGTNWGELTDVTAGDATKLTVGSEEKTITVKWKWDFEGTGEAEAKAARDASDTTLGIKAQATEAGNKPSVTVTAKVTATQVD